MLAGLVGGLSSGEGSEKCRNYEDGGAHFDVKLQVMMKMEGGESVMLVLREGKAVGLFYEISPSLAW